MSSQFVCVPLTSRKKHQQLIQGFKIDRESSVAGLPDQIIGLEAYLKRRAWDEDCANEIIERLVRKVGIKMIYLYAAGNAKLVSYYERVFEFHALDEDSFYVPLKPVYDGGCKFMFRLF